MTMETRLKTDPEMEVIPKLLCYWYFKLLGWHVGIIWGQYWFAKTRGLRTDHGGQTQDWSWNEGHPKTSMLLRSQTSSLACGDHLGLVLICQNERTQIWPWRPDSKLILKWRSSQMNTDPKWSPHANLEAWSINNIEVLGWPSFQDQSWVWPSWLRTDHGDQTQNWSWNGDHPKWTLTPNDPHM